jgi:hypothetical protein
MQAPFLPELSNLHSPVSDHTNPGMVSPADQGYPLAPSAPSTPSSAPLASSDGEIQLLDLRGVATAPPSPLGLPAQVDVAAQNCAKYSPPAVAETRPPAVDVQAGTGRPGGLPKNVCIR